MIPRGPDMAEPAEGRRLVEVARLCGFGGIGVYRGWHPYPGMHLDVRPLKPDGAPATWARIGNDYVALERAWGMAA